MSKTKKKSIWEKYAFKRLAQASKQQNDVDLYTLDPDEIVALKKISTNTFIKAGLAGALGVILLYVPYHIFGQELFPITEVTIPYLNTSLPLEIEFLAYSLILVLIEIYYLTYINLKATTEVAKICGNININDPSQEQHIDALIKVGLEKKQKDLEKLGINPFEGLSKFAVFAYQTLIKLKAAMSGFVWKLFVSKILGRYAFRMLVDLLGAPLYAGWNIYASRKVLSEARVRILAPPLIHTFTNNLYLHINNREEFKDALYKCLQIVAVSKRSFHYNHYLLASSLLEKFDISMDESIEYDKEFILAIDTFPDQIKDGLSRIILFGILIDGNLNLLEKRAISKLQDEAVITYTMEEIKQFSSDFFHGKGLDKLITF